MTVIVTDASVLVTALSDDGSDGDAARSRLRGEVLTAPELIDLEVASVLRRFTLSGVVPPRRAQLALNDLRELPLRRVTHGPLIGRCWELRDNLTMYDAAYVALAELAEVALITSDARLANAPGIRCKVEVMSSDH